jgi:hypothetical protein
MALPVKDSEWPPKAYRLAYDGYRVWDAWYANDLDKLRRVYQGAGYRLDPVARARPSQYSDGIVGRLSRWFWGRPTPTNSADPRLHIPLGSDIARASSDLLFSEPPGLVKQPVAAGASETRTSKMAGQDWYERLLKQDAWHRVLLNAAEIGAALGDVYIRAVIDEEIAPGRAFPVVVHADAAIPTIRHGHLVAVQFHRCLYEDGDVYVRLVEDHTSGRIDYALYEGRRDNIGKPIPLTEYPEAAELVPHLDENSGQDLGIDGLTVERIPNLGPNRRWRGKPRIDELGRPDIDGVEPGLDALDEAWTSWMRDLRLGKARIIADRNLMQSNGTGAGSYLDLDREVWVDVNMPPNPQGGSPITENQFEIRFAEHAATCDAITAWVLRGAGYSTSTFGEADQIAATATEIEQRERRSFTTRNRKIVDWRIGLERYLVKHQALEQARFGGEPPVALELQFGDSVTENPLDTAQTVSLLATAKAASRETLIRMVHPDWDDAQVKAEAKAIGDEQPDPAELAGSDFSGGGPKQGGGGAPSRR